MALSPNYGWAEPDNSSLVKNGAQDIRALGDAIDTSVWNIGYGQAGKNKIINGDFRIAQRGTSFSNPADLTFTLDRWIIAYDGTGATRTVSQEIFTPGAAPVAGYEGSNFIRCAQTVAGASNTRFDFRQRIEDVRTFAGQTVTVSFWAKAAATESLIIIGDQVFGSGGSATVFNAFPSTTVTLTTNWQRFTYTASVASISGKTIGTTSYFNLALRIVGGSTFTVDIWGVQFEYGSKATPFQTATGTIQGELAACQRYYYVAASGVNASICNAAAYSTNNAYGVLPFKVSMRTAPTLVQTTGTDFYTLVGGNTSDGFDSFASISNATTQSCRLDVASGITSTQLGAYWFIAASASASLAFSAEL
jgi:hypothetical protein